MHQAQLIARLRSDLDQPAHDATDTIAGLLVRLEKLEAHAGAPVASPTAWCWPGKADPSGAVASHLVADTRAKHRGDGGETRQTRPVGGGSDADWLSAGTLLWSQAWRLLR